MQWKAKYEEPDKGRAQVEPGDCKEVRTSVMK